MANESNPGAFRPDDIQGGGVVGQSGDPAGVSGGGVGAGGCPLPGAGSDAGEREPGAGDLSGGLTPGAELDDEADEDTSDDSEG